MKEKTVNILVFALCATKQIFFLHFTVSMTLFWNYLIIFFTCTVSLERDCQPLSSILNFQWTILCWILKDA